MDDSVMEVYRENNDCAFILFMDSKNVRDINKFDGINNVLISIAGDDRDFNKNMDKLLYELERKEMEASLMASAGIAPKKSLRSARFKSVVTLILDGQHYFFQGVLEGRIARRKAGKGGFGYDPVFIADDYPGVTLAEITEEQKNSVSHRGKALRAMAEFLSGTVNPR